LFDMAADPNELRNVASIEADRCAELKAAVLARWDPGAITARVLSSQARRKFINELPDAIQPVWDYQAGSDDTKRFVRRGSARVIKVKNRWPPLGGTPAAKEAQ
jgi:choline-sulfatase